MQESLHLELLVTNIDRDARTKDILNIMYVAVGALAGTVVRILLQQLPIQQFAFINDSALLANITGNFLLGLNQWAEVKKPNWDVFWETGFCGSLTSWGSWITTIILVAQNGKGEDAVTNPNIDPGQAVWQAFYTAVISFALFNLFYQFGRSWGFMTVDIFWNKIMVFPICNIRPFLMMIIFFFLIIITYTLIILSYFIFYPKTHSNQVWELALLICPFGALIRFFLAKYLNTITWFPLGTLIANYSAVLIDGFVLQFQTHEDDIVANAFKFGFVGTLGTLSRWTKEQHTFTTVYQQWIYGAVSIIPSLFIAWIIMRDWTS